MVEKMELTPEIKDKKFTPSLHVSVRNGSFGLDVPPHQFETCRERFGPKWGVETEGIYFTHPDHQGVAVATFIKKTEMILNQKEFSQFSLTNHDNVLWVEPTYFWKSCRMKRSLLTIMLRAGMVYEPALDNYEQALFTEQWAKPTKLAVMRFLFGFTKYIGPTIDDQTNIESRGWKFVFEGHDDDVKQYLVWPDNDCFKPKGQISGIWF